MTFGECDLSLVCVWPAHWFDYWSSSHLLSPVLHLFEVLTGLTSWRAHRSVLKDLRGPVWGRKWCRQSMGSRKVSWTWWVWASRVSSAGPGSEQDLNTQWMTKWMKMEIFPQKSKTVSSSVTESNLVLLTSWQANKLRDEFLGQGIVTLFRSPGPLSQDTSCLS